MQRPWLWLPVLLPVGLVAAFIIRWRSVSEQRPAAGKNLAASLHVDPKAGLAALEIEARENEIASNVWRGELRAEEYGAAIDRVWDEINAGDDRYGVLKQLHIPMVQIAGLSAVTNLDHGIEMRTFDGPGITLDENGWAARLESWRDFAIVQIEARHVKFEPEKAARPARSTVALTAHLLRSADGARRIINGDLEIDWSAGQTPDQLPRPQRVGLSRWVMLDRTAPPAFKRVAVKEIAPFERTLFIDPLIVYDLDGDGRAEVILAARNLVFRQRAGGRFDGEQLLDVSPPLIFCGTVADFDQDGFPDFLCADRSGLLLYPGNAEGRFSAAPRRVWSAPTRLEYVQALTVGDVNGDGALDVWLVQYKPPYVGGQMPAPYFDANDGNPSYLLLNNGKTEFRDATVETGLAEHRHRRSYSASFVDLDGDGDLDLVVVSDFCGIELYLNDGLGHFRDVTAEKVEERHLLGMAHAVGDFDGDGRLDLLAIGMNSPVADRLRHLGGERAGFPEYASMLPAMTYGNRLYLGGGDRFRQAPFNDQIARTGWAWGVTAFDFDNDGDLDFYVVNGHSSNRSVRDYEPQFWMHDIFVGRSTNNAAVDQYFRNVNGRTRARGDSYGGYEKNRLFINQKGKSFIEAGYLMGVAMEQDCRNVVSEDLDGDGREDLLLTTFEIWPEPKQRLHIFKNTLESSNHWLAVKLRELGGGRSPVGARVTLTASGSKQTRWLVTGDSHRSQHSPTAHFGLGAARAVESIEIRWPNGKVQTLPAPAVDRELQIKN